MLSTILWIGGFFYCLIAILAWHMLYSFESKFNHLAEPGVHAQLYPFQCAWRLLKRSPPWAKQDRVAFASHLLNKLQLDRPRDLDPCYHGRQFYWHLKQINSADQLDSFYRDVMPRAWSILPFVLMATFWPIALIVARCYNSSRQLRKSSL